jgi:hypothetical protein
MTTNSTIVSLPYFAGVNETAYTYINGIRLCVKARIVAAGLDVYVQPLVHAALYPIETRFRCTLLTAALTPTRCSFVLEHVFHEGDNMYGNLLVESGKPVPVVDGKMTIRVRAEMLRVNQDFVLGVASAALAADPKHLVLSLRTCAAELETMRAKLLTAAKDTEEAVAAAVAAATAAAPAAFCDLCKRDVKGGGQGASDVVDLASSPKRQRLDDKSNADQEDRLRALLERRNPAEMRRELAITETAAQRLRAAIEEADLCVTCMAAKREATFVPCKHMACCEACSRRLTVCCMCREPITDVIVPKMA